MPAVWVDRTGVKVGITEQYSRNSKGSLALVAQVSAGLPGAVRVHVHMHGKAELNELCPRSALCKRHPGVSCLPLLTLFIAALCSVPQGITTRDETGAPCARGMRTTPFGQYVADGPPTCLSGEP